MKIIDKVGPILFTIQVGLSVISTPEHCCSVYYYVEYTANTLIGGTSRLCCYSDRRVCL